jgi:hypothetical protein
MKKHFKTNDVLELTDKVSGEKVSACFGSNCTGLYAQFDHPLQIIPLMHVLEYSHSQGFEPSGVELKKLGEPEYSIDISEENPDWNVYVVAYKRETLESKDLLNAYNRFLKKGFRQFPSNILIKSANRQELEQLSQKADYREGDLLFFSNPAENSNNLNSINNYPIQYKIK